MQKRDVLQQKRLPVSLFTREWIEILIAFSPAIWKSSVSLFTREWIEIDFADKAEIELQVSLFTREWIEIQPCR